LAIDLSFQIKPLLQEVRAGDLTRPLLVSCAGKFLKKKTHTLIGLGKIMSIVVLYLVCQQVRIARNSWMHKLNSYTQLSNEKDVFPKPLTLDSCGHLAHGLAALV